MIRTSQSCSETLVSSPNYRQRCYRTDGMKTRFPFLRANSKPARAGSSRKCPETIFVTFFIHGLFWSMPIRMRTAHRSSQLMLSSVLLEVDVKP